MAMEKLAPVGVREIKNNFSYLSTRVNETGQPLTVLKNNKPWVVIQPAEPEAKARQERIERFKKLTWAIENEPFELRDDFDQTLSDEEILHEELMRRHG